MFLIFSTDPKSIGMWLFRWVSPFVLAGIGGHGLFVYFGNREPYATTYAEFARTLPDHEWVELKDTELDLTEALFTETLGDVSEVFIPMHAPDEPKDAKVQAMIFTRDPAIVALVGKLKAITNPQARNQFVVQHRERIYSHRTVRGLLQTGFNPDSPSSIRRSEMVKIYGNLNWEFAVIEEGEKPQLLIWLAVFLGAFPAAWFLWFRPTAGMRKPPAAAPSPHPQ